MKLCTITLPLLLQRILSSQNTGKNLEKKQWFTTKVNIPILQHTRGKKMALTSILQALRSICMKYVTVPATLTVHAE